VVGAGLATETWVTASLYTGWNLRANGDVASLIASTNTVQFLDGWGVDVTRSTGDVTIKLDTSSTGVATAYDLAQSGFYYNNNASITNINNNDTLTVFEQKYWLVMGL